MSLIHPRHDAAHPALPRTPETRRAPETPSTPGTTRTPRTSRPGRTGTRSRPAPDVARARLLLLSLYLLLGLTVASWLSRLPSIRESLDLSTGQLGTILLVGALGSLVTVLGAGAFVGRWGSRVTLLTAAVAYSFALVLMGLGPALGSVPLLVVGVAIMSASFGLGNVPLNVESVVIELRMGRTIVPQFHAAFSVGSVVGSLIGAAASWAHVPVVVHFGLVSVVALIWRFRAVPGSVLRPVTTATSPTGSGATGAALSGAAVTGDAPPARLGAGLRESLSAWRERRTLLIGIVVMAAALSEGSANNWLAIAVVDGFQETEAVAAVVFGVFVASMTAVRLAGTGLIDRFGRVAVLAGSGVASVTGLLIFALSPSLALAVVGAALWGTGAGLAIPIGMAAVSADPLRAAGRVAVVSAFASVSSIAAPPLIGLAAEVLGTRHALLLIAVAIVAGIAFSRSVRVPQGAPVASGPASADVATTGATAAVFVPSDPPDTLERLDDRDLHLSEARL